MSKMRFEVGKTYKDTTGSNLIGKCIVSTKRYAILEDNTGEWSVEQYHRAWYEEYVPPKPLTFDDLKVGEKFKWVKTRDCGPGVICLKLEVVGGVNGPKIPFAYCASQYGWTALEGNRIGTIWGQNNEEVERVS